MYECLFVFSFSLSRSFSHTHSLTLFLSFSPSSRNHENTADAITGTEAWKKTTPFRLRVWE
eukprot:m.345379 g.345379  ORF g.345379 m.345379 type:complete len:61 (-) comp16140_c3_seq5:1391-1573(-)